MCVPAQKYMHSTNNCSVTECCPDFSLKIVSLQQASKKSVLIANDCEGGIVQLIAIIKRFVVPPTFCCMYF